MGSISVTSAPARFCMPRWLAPSCRFPVRRSSRTVWSPPPGRSHTEADSVQLAVVRCRVEEEWVGQHVHRRRACRHGGSEPEGQAQGAVLGTDVGPADDDEGGKVRLPRRVHGRLRSARVLRPARPAPTARRAARLTPRCARCAARRSLRQCRRAPPRRSHSGTTQSDTAHPRCHGREGGTESVPPRPAERRGTDTLPLGAEPGGARGSGVVLSAAAPYASNGKART